MDEVQLDRATIRLLPVVRGLPSEASTVRLAIDSTRPTAVGLSIGPEELRTLRSYDGGPLGPDNFEEEIYVAGLSAWEPAIKPPRASPTRSRRRTRAACPSKPSTWTRSRTR